MLRHGPHCHMYKAEPEAPTATDQPTTDAATNIYNRDRDWNEWRVNDNGDPDMRGNWIALNALAGINGDIDANL